MDIVLRCPAAELASAEISIDFGDNEKLEESSEERRTVFLSAKCGVSSHGIPYLARGAPTLSVSLFYSAMSTSS